ncbi:DUF4144 family protein [Leucothrix pacifica]|uniref:Uncharacterized protein n=1 Tax=Leucothrix pacifica TaxID=1247513 RepID=A0A317CAV0_9GAMM|nr:DUF4144 family protein [Leucothrix pacifica]PWQ95497.1 hypothetical protein DKW60_14885 [Leucothrix pacifica]
MITWPAVIKYDGDNELGYVASQLEWETDPDFSEFRYSEADQLIDSVGVIYSLEEGSDGVASPKNTGNKISLDDITLMLREHASALENCCVSKLGFYSIAEAVGTAGDLK